MRQHRLQTTQIQLNTMKLMLKMRLLSLKTKLQLIILNKITLNNMRSSQFGIIQNVPFIRVKIFMEIMMNFYKFGVEMEHIFSITLDGLNNVKTHLMNRMRLNIHV